MSNQKAMISFGFLLITLGIFPLSSAIESYSKDYWWTNNNMKISLDDASDIVEIFVFNKLLKNELSDGVIIINNGLEKQLSVGDFSVRVNRVCEMTRNETVLATFFISSGISIILCSLILTSKKSKLPQ